MIRKFAEKNIFEIKNLTIFKVCPTPRYSIDEKQKFPFKEGKAVQ